MGRIMGFDIGQKRLGVAVSDNSASIATPLTVLAVDDLKADLSPLKRLCRDWEVEYGVVGLPLSMDGTEGPQALEVRTLADMILKPLGFALVFVDERLSTTEAKQALHEMGKTERQFRGKVDMLAATFFLQTYLDSMKAK